MYSKEDKIKKVYWHNEADISILQYVTWNLQLLIAWAFCHMPPIGLIL